MPSSFDIFFHVINPSIGKRPCYYLLMYKDDSVVYEQGGYLEDADKKYDVVKKFINFSIDAMDLAVRRGAEKLNIYTRNSNVCSFINENSIFIKENSGIDVNAFSMKGKKCKGKNRDRMLHCTENCGLFYQNKNYKKIGQYNHLYCDASHDLETNICAWAVFIKKKDGTTYKTYGACHHSVQGSQEAEVYAIVSGLKVAERNGIKIDTVYTDCLPVLQRKEYLSISNIIRENSLPQTDIQWIKRNSTKEHSYCDSKAREAMKFIRNSPELMKEKIVSSADIYYVGDRLDKKSEM